MWRPKSARTAIITRHRRIGKLMEERASFIQSGSIRNAITASCLDILPGIVQNPLTEMERERGKGPKRDLERVTQKVSERDLEKAAMVQREPRERARDLKTAVGNAGRGITIPTAQKIRTGREPEKEACEL